MVIKHMFEYDAVCYPTITAAANRARNNKLKPVTRTVYLFFFDILSCNAFECASAVRAVEFISDNGFCFLQNLHLISPPQHAM